MSIVVKLCAFFTIIATLLGFLYGFSVFAEAKAVTHQIAGLTIALVAAVVPYVLMRAVETVLKPAQGG